MVVATTTPPGVVARYSLAAERHQLIEQLLRSRDDPSAAAVLRRRQDQLDKVLADVRVRELDSTGRQRAQAAIAGVALDRLARVHALREHVVADLLQARVI